jgi:hypothetical protein
LNSKHPKISPSIVFCLLLTGFSGLRCQDTSQMDLGLQVSLGLSAFAYISLSSFVTRVAFFIFYHHPILISFSDKSKFSLSTHYHSDNIIRDHIKLSFTLSTSDFSLLIIFVFFNQFNKINNFSIIVFINFLRALIKTVYPQKYKIEFHNFLLTLEIISYVTVILFISFLRVVIKTVYLQKYKIKFHNFLLML